MVAERRHQIGLLAAWSAAAIVACIPFNERRIDPNEENPFKDDRPEDAGVARIKAFIAKRQWAAMANAAKQGRG